MNYFNAEIDNLWALNMPAVDINGKLSRVPSYFIPELLAAVVSPAQLATYNAFLSTLIPLSVPYTTMTAAFDDMPAQGVTFSGTTSNANALLTGAYSAPPETGLNNACAAVVTLTNATATAWTTNNVGALYNPPVAFADISAQAATMAGQNNQVLVQVNPLLTTTAGTGTAVNLAEIATQAAAAATIASDALAAAVALRAVSLGGPTPVTIQAAETTMATATDQMQKFLDYIAGLGGPTNIVGPGTTYPTFAAFLTAQGVPL